jgi:hypothetical protein
VTELIPEVAAADALADAQWFDVQPDRRYRLRRRWAIRSRGHSTFLRTPIIGPDHPGPDTEAVAERAWWTAAYPNLEPKARDAMVRAARKTARPTRRRAPAARGSP